MRATTWLFIFVSFISTKALAFGADMTASENYQLVRGGTENLGEAGLSQQATWLRNSETGYAPGGVAGFVYLGRFTITPESGILYLNMEQGEDGVAVIPGGKVRF